MIVKAKNKIISYIMVATIILSSIFPNVSLAQTDDTQVFSDVEGHWAEDIIIKHAKRGLLNGYPDGTFKPDQGMKRCELISVINRYFGLKNKSNDNYDDISDKAWYAEDTAKAKYYSYVRGLTVEPNKEATREDVIGMLAIILDMEEQSKLNKSTTYSDLEKLKEENRKNINEFSKLGYVQGYPDGEFKPKKIINRAEILSITEAVLGYIVTNQEDLDNIPKNAKKITIINPDITIENLDTEADIYISAGVNGRLTIKNSKLKGKVEIAGGTKKNPIQLENVEVGKLVITKAKENPTVNLVSTDVEEVKVKSEATINTDKKTVIKKADISSKSNWTGQGKIQKAYVKTNDIKIEKKPQYVVVTDKKISVRIGSKEVTYKTDDKESHNGSSNSGSQGSNKTSITKVEITGQTKQGEILTGVVLPAGATVTYKWQRENVAGNYEDIIGATSATYTLSTNDVNKKIRVRVVGTGNYKGELTSQSTNAILSNDPIAVKIKDGWIPVVNKEELKQINNDSNQTFGVGTKYEDIYTGGMDKKYMLLSNIDLSGENFIPIGYNSGTPIDFVGEFTGKGYSIRNLTIDRDEEYQGLFSKLGVGSKITDVTIDTVNIKTSSYSAPVAGESKGATIENTSVSNVVYEIFEGKKTTGNDDYVTNKRIGLGGVVGKSTNSTFKNTTLNNFSLEFTDDRRKNANVESIGGLVGYMNGGTISNCHIEDITLKAIHNGPKGEKAMFHGAAGMVGTIHNTSVNELRINDSSVTGVDLLTGGVIGFIVESCGGFIGEISHVGTTVETNGDIIISNNHVTGTIQGIDHENYMGNFGSFCTGGFVGYVVGRKNINNKVVINDSYSSVKMYDFINNQRAIDNYLQIGGIGGFIGRGTRVDLNNCYSTGTIGVFGDYDPRTCRGNKIDEKSVLSGFGGCINNSRLVGCYSTGDVNAASYSGGFISVAFKCEIERCYSTSTLKTKREIMIGSFIGTLSDSTVRDSYCLGDTYGLNAIASFIYSINTNGKSKIENCYSGGNVIAEGTLLSFLNSKNVICKNCYFKTTDNVGIVGNGREDCAGILGKTTEELKQLSTFDGWDISKAGSGQNTVWLIEEGVNYPYLNDDYIPVISSECEVTTWNTPASPVMGGSNNTDVSKTVSKDTTELIIDIEVSSRATWKLFSDSSCTTELSDKRVTLEEGDNTVYLKIVAQDGSSNKVYTLTITKESPIKVSSISVTGEGNVTSIATKGGTLQMLTEVLPTNADNKGVTWSVDDESIATISSTGLLTAVDDGTVTVTAFAKDGSCVKGQLDITVSGQVEIDTKPPTGYGVSIDQANINDSNKSNVSFTFSDAEVGTTYYLSIDDSNELTSAITKSGKIATSSDQVTDIDVSNLNDGTLTLTVYLADESGNEGSNVTDTVLKDTVIPTGYGVSIDQADINNSNKENLSFTFSDAEVGITYYFSIDDSNGLTANIAKSGTIVTSSDQVTDIDVSNLNDETLTLTVYLADDSGNQGSNVTDTVLKDTQAPTGYGVSIDQADINNSNKENLSFTFNNAELGANYYISIDDSNESTSAIMASGTIVTSSDQLVGIDVSDLDDGTLTLTVYLVDSSGNRGSDATTSVSKDTSGYILPDKEF